MVHGVPFLGVEEVVGELWAVDPDPSDFAVLVEPAPPDQDDDVDLLAAELPF
jgi:hypothetical protein